MRGIGTGAIAAAFAVLTACAPHQPEAERPPLVQTVIIGARAANGPSFTGSIQARTESDIAFRVPGKLLSRSVEAGDVVRRGQLLARLDPADYALASTAAQAEVADALAQNKRALDDLRRFAPLAQRGFVTGRSLDAARADADSASARLRAAQARARALGNQSGYAALVADSDGVVMSIAAEPGQVVTAGQPVIRIARQGPRDLVVAIPEGRQSVIRDVADVVVYGVDRHYTATLHSLAAAADPATRTYLARFEIANGSALPLGATATARFSAGNTMRMTVPLGALHDEGQGWGVWTVDRKSRVTFRPVRVVGLDEENAEISGGLKSGERIVILGAHLLQQGQAVRYAGDGRAR